MVSEIMAETFTLHDVHICERVYVAFLLQKKVKKKQQQSMTHESIQEFNFHINISHFWHIHTLRFYRPTFFRRRLQKWACIYGLYVRSPLSYKIMAVIKVLRNVKHKFLPSFNKKYSHMRLSYREVSQQSLSLSFFLKEKKSGVEPDFIYCSAFAQEKENERWLTGFACKSALSLPARMLSTIELHIEFCQTTTVSLRSS